jgi:nitroreductase
LDDILKVAHWTGSARNLQPWELLVVRDRETLQAMAAVEGRAKHLASAPIGVVLVMTGDPTLQQQETFDEGRLSERMLLAAAVHGVAGCIGWFFGEGREAVKLLLGIPPERLVRTAVSFGYADEQAHRARPKRPEARKPLSAIVKWEHY